MITSRELSDDEKFMAWIGSLVKIIPGVSEAGIIAKAGAKTAINY